tara:strand:- start:93 stop:638 length:546 start_codon:yes stop_codon:yes gene_type:complete
MSDDNRKEKLWEPFDGDALFILFKTNDDKMVWHRALPGTFRSWKGRRKIIKHTTAHRQPVVSTTEEEYFGPVFYRDTNFYYDGTDTYGLAERSDKPRLPTVPRPHEDEAWMNGPSMLDGEVVDNFSGLKETNYQDWNSSIKMDDLLVKSTKEEVLGLSNDEVSELDKAIDNQKEFLNGKYK